MKDNVKIRAVTNRYEPWKILKLPSHLMRNLTGLCIKINKNQLNLNLNNLIIRLFSYEEYSNTIFNFYKVVKISKKSHILLK